MIIVIEIRPYKAARDNRMNILGDITVLMISYTFFCFNVTDIKTNFVLGYAPIAIVSLYICMSLVIIMVESFVVMRKRCKVYLIKRSYFKKRSKNPAFKKFSIK